MSTETNAAKAAARKVEAERLEAFCFRTSAGEALGALGPAAVVEALRAECAARGDKLAESDGGRANNWYLLSAALEELRGRLEGRKF